MRAGLRVLATLLACAVSHAAAAEPVRVATLLPWVADALERAPEKATLVAMARRDLHRPPPEGIVDLGNPHSPSLEQLAVARPSLVIGDAVLHGRLRPGLARSGAEVMLVESAGVDATFESLIAIGQRVGAEAELGSAVEEARGELQKLALDDPVPTLTLFGAPGSFYAMTERTWLGDLLARLNFRNVSTGTPGDERYPGLVPINDEAMATLRPELLLLVTHGDPTRIRESFDERVRRGGPWRSVSTSAGRGVHALDPSLFATNPGLALPSAARALVALLEGPAPVAAQGDAGAAP